MTINAYEVEPDGENFKSLDCHDPGNFDLACMYARPIKDVQLPTFRIRTLEEENAAEQEMLDMGETADFEGVKKRFANGVGDCAFVYSFAMGLFISKPAAEHLSHVLKTTGQLFPVLIDGSDFFIYNCTRLLDAVDRDYSEMRYVGNQRPAAFTKLRFKPDVIANETLFKTKWPEPTDVSSPVDYSKIPPVTEFFATQRFVDLVEDAGLTGFRFKPVDENYTSN